MIVHELKTEVPLAAIGQIEDWLAELEEQRLMVLEDKVTARAWLVGYFETAEAAGIAWRTLVRIADAEWAGVEPQIRELPDVDWKESYKAHFKASKFGRLHWVPVWERETFTLPAGEEVLWLDPGMAFGTGNHETTRLCCERLARHAEKRGRAGSVIDAGCGSGILALSAAKLGFTAVAGFDNDPEAIRVSRENAGLNGLTGKVDFQVGDLITGFQGRRADLVLANIQSDVLVRFANELVSAVAPGGELVLSGILSRELDEMRTRFSEIARGWTLESRGLGEWADLSLAS